MKAEVTVHLADLDEVKNALRDAADRIELLRSLISDLTDDESCSYDHHGYCQTHGWFDDETTCPHARAKRLAPEQLQARGLTQRQRPHPFPARTTGHGRPTPKG